MKKTIILLSSLASLVMFGQHHSCGIDHYHEKLEKQNPEIKQNRQLLESKIQKKGLDNVLQELLVQYTPSNETVLSTQSTGSTAYNGPIYEIPVVVHVIESTNPADVKVTDTQIKNWIEDTNKIFATTYGKGFYTEGEGADGGTIMPFKLVLAKRTPDNQPTNGIIRKDASGLSTYLQNGANLDSKGATFDEIRNFSKHWPEHSYYNIYLVSAFDGYREGFGTSGIATYPWISDAQYDTFIKTYWIGRGNNHIGAHEVGHSLGLFHTFEGVGVNENPRTTCPKNTGNCDTDNDRVCDTEPTRELMSLNPTPSNSDVNPCTGIPYTGTQYNIMGYSNSPRKFTPGQRNRALVEFLGNRGILTKSLGGKSPDFENDVEITASCNVTTDRPNNRVSIGFSRIQLGNIDNKTATGVGYVDYTAPAQTITNAGFQTNIIDGKPQTITITKPSVNGQSTRVWIDYNNNGTFENNELVINRQMANTDTTYIHTFTPPITAVKEKFLRMRVRGDWSAAGACDKLAYGDVEDYAVRIVPENWVDPANSTIGRVGINTEEPKATLDIRETTEVPETQPQGVLFPNFTTEQRATFQDVAEGTMIFNTTLKCLEIYSNGAWKCLN